MKKYVGAIIIIMGLGLTFGYSFGADKTRIAVVDFGVSGIPESDSRQITQIFRDILAQSQLVNVPSRDEVEAALAQRDILYKTKLSQVECQNVSCAVKVGAFLKADKTIIGKIVKDEKRKNSLVWAKLINVSQRDVEFIASIEGPLDADFNQLATKLGEKVANWLPKPGETEEQAKKRRIAQQQKEEKERNRQREERLKKLAHRDPGTCPEGMVLVPAGEFVMGSDPADSDRRDNEAKNKKVMVKEFCIDKYEYQNKKRAVPYRKAEWFAGRGCEEQGKRLCSEAEWEKACKGTKGFKYPYGNQFDQQKCNVGRRKGDRVLKGKTARSGANEGCVSDYGAYDMSGNVWEWVADYYDPDTKTFVLKGGSYGSSPEAARCSMRREGMAFMRRKDIGLRCCK